ncbi:MAG: hypothetical protein KBD78_07185 [Oligoflexales bacterium]|nr:hypothetical protein [Oligoflexales bacterium]
MLRIPIKAGSAGIFLSLSFLYCSVSAYAKENSAVLMHTRIAGVPPKKDVRVKMEELIKAGKRQEAALLAMENNYFYDLMLKNWIAPWTNEEQSSRVELNDFTATIIGLIRDDEPFNLALSGDVIYVASPESIAAAAGRILPYSPTNNDHYRSLENSGQSLKTSLSVQKQSELQALPLEATAGVLTTRAAGEAFYKDGTNRAVLRFTLMNFMCNDLEQLSDITRSDYRVRRDVERNPGGTTITYKTKCVGCHSGMDPLAGAFAYYNWNENRLVHTAGQVQEKYNFNPFNFPDGYVTTDDSWQNIWTEGPNKRLGFRGEQEGNGAKSFGEMLGASRGFSECMATKVFERLCLQNGNQTKSKRLIKRLADSFEAEGKYSMKQLYANTAAACFK